MGKAVWVGRIEDPEALPGPRDGAVPAPVKGPVRGLRRTCSVYLASAFLVLLGGYVALHDGSGAPRWDELEHVFATQVLYELLLLFVIAYLHRFRGAGTAGYGEETLFLTGVLALFVFDALALQHLYGWTEREGRTSAAVGFVSGLVLVGALRLVLRLSLRLTLTAVSSLAVIRFGGFLLAGDEPAPGALSPRFVGLSWILASCLLPALVLGEPEPARGAPSRSFERRALLTVLAVAVLHVIPMGNAMGHRFEPAYLAPLVILAGPVLERLLPRSGRYVDWLPVAGLALTATTLTPSLLDRPWANRLPLTPFWLAALLVTAVSIGRAVSLRRPGLVRVAAVAASAAILGGDLPEVLARAVYPEPWQALTVVALLWWTIASAPSISMRGALGLHAMSAAVLASLLARASYPWLAGYLVLLAAGILALERLSGEKLPPRARVSILAMLALVPAAATIDPTVVSASTSIVVAGAVATLLLVSGGLTSDRLLIAGGVLSGVVTGAVQIGLAYGRAELHVGRILIQAGFVFLLAAFVRTTYGDQLKAQARRWALGA